MVDGMLEAMAAHDRSHLSANGYDATWLRDLEPMHPPEDDGCPPPLPDEAYAGEVESTVMQFPARGQGDAAPARTVTLLYGDGVPENRSWRCSWPSRWSPADHVASSISLRI